MNVKSAIHDEWLVVVVPVAELAAKLTELELSHPPISPPILTYIDITRVLVAWRY